MPITFDLAVTQHTAAMRRLRSVSLQMATGKREMSGIQLDPANFSMAAKFDTQVYRLDAALSNAGNAVSLLQTQDGTLRSVGKALNRMGELAILAQDVTKSDAYRALYAEEFTQLKTMISDSAGMTFNGVKMFGSQSKSETVNEDGGTTDLPAINLLADPYAVAVADENCHRHAGQCGGGVGGRQGRHEPSVHRSHQSRLPAELTGARQLWVQVRMLCEGVPEDPSFYPVQHSRIEDSSAKSSGREEFIVRARY